MKYDAKKWKTKKIKSGTSRHQTTQQNSITQKFKITVNNNFTVCFIHFCQWCYRFLLNNKLSSFLSHFKKLFCGFYLVLNLFSLFMMLLIRILKNRANATTFAWFWNFLEILRNFQCSAMQFQEKSVSLTKIMRKLLCLLY